MDRLKILPLPRHHIPLLGQFQTSDERAGPRGAPPQGQPGFPIGMVRHIGQESLERHPLRRRGEKSQDTFAGRRT